MFHVLKLQILLKTIYEEIEGIASTKCVLAFPYNYGIKVAVCLILYYGSSVIIILVHTSAIWMTFAGLMFGNFLSTD